MDSLNIEIPDEVHELFEIVMDNAVDRPKILQKGRSVSWNLPKFQYQVLSRSLMNMRTSGTRIPQSITANRMVHISPQINVADWIDLSTLFTDWAGLRVTSHCYRVGGTSFLYRAGGQSGLTPQIWQMAAV